MTLLSPQMFAIFATLVEEVSGLHYGPQERALFSEKLVAHAAECGHDMLLDYYYRLRYDDADRAELDKLVEALLVHETYLFRDLGQLTQLVDGHLAQVIASRGRVRIWSAACSTGEEPYTLAMLLDVRGLLDAAEIVATDISASAIERARQGRHRRQALRSGHPTDLALRYTEATDRDISVVPRIRNAVQFSTLNLVDPAPWPALGTFDAILCRNVLIYFKDPQILRVIDRLAGHLAADGRLAIGVSESLLRFGTGLVCEERGNAFFYRCAR